jgi:hypothetical protein
MLSALFLVMHTFHAAYSLLMGLSTEVSIIPYRQGNSEELNAVVWEGDRPGWKANPMTLNGNLNASNTEILEKKGVEVVSVLCKAGDGSQRTDRH